MIVCGGGLVVAALAALWLAFPSRVSPAQLTAQLPPGFVADVQQGEILFHTGGCANCHSADPLAAKPQLGGGAALETAFGSFKPSNISPDPDAGIGGWSDADFVTAMTRGVSPRGQHYYPAFPYSAYQNVPATDLLHLKAYLDQLPEVAEPASKHQLAFPFNVRLGVGVWKAAFLRPVKAPEGLTPEQARGFEVVNGLGHCSTCHTPRNLAFAEVRSKAFQGGPPLKQGERAAPRLAGEKEDVILGGLDEFAGAVRESSSMWHVTQSYSANVPYEDHEAIAAYLSSLPGK